MRGWPRYAQYKASGVAWLGDVPEHWDVIRGAYIGRLFGSEAIAEDEVLEEGITPFLKVGSLSSYGFDVNSWDWYTNSTKNLQSDYLVFPKRGAAIFLNKVNIIKVPSLIDPNLMGWKLNKKAMNKFFAYVLKSKQLKEIADVSTVPQINNKHVNSEKFPVPPLTEQTAIAQFLDQKTAQIDALISKKQQLLEKLAEQRTALISHAVTKGLDPNAPMKDSGVAWLGEVPEHWEVMAVKFTLAMPITDGPHETPEILTDGVPFLSAESVKNDQLDFEKKRGYISLEDDIKFSKKYKPKFGDVYMVKSGATTGNVARVTTYDDFNIWSPLAAMRPDADIVLTDFLFFTLKADYFFASVKTKWSYGTQQNIGMGVLSNIKITVPPINEQEMIVELIEKELAQLDQMASKVKAVIDKLKEYRAALITQAVTGQIDVRGLIDV